MEKLSAWIKNASAKGAIPVLAGRNGDMDTIGSAVALATSNPKHVSVRTTHGASCKTAV